MTDCHFWTNIMLRQPRVRASRASPAQKLQGLRVVLCQKLFKGYFFVLIHSVDRYVFEHFLPVKQIWRKSAVWTCENESLFSLVDSTMLSDTRINYHIFFLDHKAWIKPLKLKIFSKKTLLSWPPCIKGHAY